MKVKDIIYSAGNRYNSAKKKNELVYGKIRGEVSSGSNRPVAIRITSRAGDELLIEDLETIKVFRTALDNIIKEINEQKFLHSPDWREL